MAEITEIIDSASDDLALPCGLEATTGSYLHPAVPLASLAGGGPDRREAAEVKEWLRRSKGGHLGPRAGVDPTDLSSAGWGVVFSNGCSPAVREALAPLLAHRRARAAARRETWYRELQYQPGDTKPDFLERHGAGGAGPADPRELPYFLLLVGGPEEIPFEFQHQLDVQYAVGRVAFNTTEEYARYAASVMAAETSASSGAPAGPHRAVLFGPRNSGDLATDRMAGHLIRPLAEALSDHSVEMVIEGDATKERLSRLLGGDETPSLLFTATHGMGFPGGHPRQRDCQGALVCQDWPGPAAWKGPVQEGHYFHAADVDGGAKLTGLVSFHFACHSGGTLEPEGFLARLPQRLLGHPNGGALAVIGHVERTWGHSFLWKGRQTEVFEDVLGLVLGGWPVGAALDAFGQRYATLSSELVEEQRLASLGKRTDPARRAKLWTAAQDARNYLLLGDPAVRLLAPV